MEYATYTQYTENYKGNTIAEADFPRLVLMASVTIDLLTNDRAAAIVTADTATATIEKIMMATCAVADVLARLEGTGGQVVQSESVGRASVSYFAPKSKNNQAQEAANLYLWSTGLMYRGFTADERGD